MSREIRFTATDEEYAEIAAYVVAKKRWRKVAHFLRDATFQAMDRNPVGKHGSERGAVLHRMPGGQESPELGGGKEQV